MATKQAWICREMLPLNYIVDFHQEGDVVFYANGTFRIHNRLFASRQPVNYQSSGCHAKRDAKDNRLSVTAGGVHYVFEYSFGVWYRWIAEVSSPDGTIDTTDLPHVSLLRRHGWRACVIAIMALVWMLWSGK